MKNIKIDIDFSAVGSKVKAKRCSLGLSQEQLAEMCAITPSYVGHIERGTRNLSLTTAIRISSVLGISLDYLLLDTVKNDCSVLDRISNELKNHNENQVKKFLSTVKILADNIDNL